MLRIWTVVCRDCRWSEVADDLRDGNAMGSAHLESAHRALSYPQGFVVHNTYPARNREPRSDEES
jgi:hypothetical protein